MSRNPESALTQSARAATSDTALWRYAIPALFVLLWSTGFIFAKLGIPYAPPLLFLALRHVIVSAVLIAWTLARGDRWPSSWVEVGHIALVGVLLHGVYLGGVYVAFALGIEAGTSALIVSVQPLLVAALAGPLLKERVSPRQWLGLALGLAGVAVVVWRKAGLSADSFLAAGLCVGSLIAITAALLYQKRYLSNMPFLAGNALQFVAAASATLAVALLFEQWRIEWTWRFILSLSWLVVVLSLGAVALLLLLIRRGAATRVASLFFLVPPTAALMAWPLFGETLSLAELAGMVLVMLGVALVNLRAKRP